MCSRLRPRIHYIFITETDFSEPALVRYAVKCDDHNLRTFMDCSPVSLVFEHHCINQLMTSIHAPLPRTDDILTFIGAYLHPEDVRSFPPRSLSRALDRRELKFCLVFPPNGVVSQNLLWNDCATNIRSLRFVFRLSKRMH